MKTYQGTRDIDGLRVTVDGRRLPEHYALKQFTKWGFEWTYEGASPRQLALAILYDHLGDKDRAIDLSEPFMRRVIADLDNDWTLTEEEIERAIKDISGALGQRPVIVEVGDHPSHKGLGELDRAILIAEVVVENGERQLLRARAFVGPLEAPFGELLDFIMLGQSTAIDRDFETVDIARSLISLHGSRR